MRTILSKLISRIKGEAYVIDPRLTFTMVLISIYPRFCMLIRASLKMPIRSFRARLFLGKSAKIRLITNLTNLGSFTLNDHSYVDCMSSERNEIGRNFSFGDHSKIICTSVLSDLGVGFDIGDNVGINAFCYLGAQGGLLIGENTIIGPYTKIFTENHNHRGSHELIRMNASLRAAVKIGKNCWLGSGVTVLPGALVGDNCVIAAGAIVRGEVPPGTLYINKNKIYQL